MTSQPSDATSSMVSEALAEWASGLAFDDLPEPVMARAKQSVADCLAECLFVGMTKPWGQTVAGFALEHGGAQPESTVIGSGAKTLAAQAALANGTMALGYEYADVIWTGSSRPYPFSVPPALALAESQHRSGRDLIVAVVAAYETMRRVSAGMSRAQIEAAVQRRFYPAALVGMFGAAAAAGKVTRLSPEELRSALAIVSAVPGGTFHGHYSGSWTRSLQGGLASERGVLAALLAKRGFVASRQPVEDFYVTFAGPDYNAEAILDGLGESWAISLTWTKAYPLNATLHSSIEALSTLMREHDLDYRDIDSIHASWHMYARFLANAEVRSPVAAQASLPFALAAAAVRGGITVEEFTEESVADPEIQALLRRVTVEPNSELYELVGAEGVPSRVTVRTKGGREITHEVLFPKGHPRNPMSRAEFRTKFLDITTRVLPLPRCEDIYRSVMQLEEMDDVGELGALLGPA